MNDKLDIVDVTAIVPDKCTPLEAAAYVPKIINQSVENLAKIQSKIQEVRNDADTAKREAMDAYLVEVGFFHRTTPALEALQSAGLKQSEALVNISECQELLFVQQQVLAQFSKILFVLCCANIASAKIAVQQIQAKLANASEEEISEIARNELFKTMQQLKQQIDLLGQQERLRNDVQNLKSALENRDKSIEQQNARINSLAASVQQLTQDSNNNNVQNLKRELKNRDKTIQQQNARINNLAASVQKSTHDSNSNNSNIRKDSDIPSQNVDSDENARNRKIIYIILALALGSFGLHDFYAGKVGKALIKIAIVVFSAGALAMVSGIWAVIDVIVACNKKDFFTTDWRR